MRLCLFSCNCFAVMIYSYIPYIYRSNDMKYPYLLLDADNTLFDFDAGNRHAFHEVCARYDIPDTDESFLCYERCNNAMWTAFDRGECTKDFLVVERFRLFLKEMGLDRNPVLCNDLHLQVLGQNTLMLPHAQEVCRMLSQEHRLYIVTNAVASVQRSRLAAPLRRISPEPLSQRRPEPASPAPPILTMSFPISTALPGTTACWWETLCPATYAAPTTPGFPAAGTIPRRRLDRMICGSTMRSGICDSCMTWCDIII